MCNIDDKKELLYLKIQQLFLFVINKEVVMRVKDILRESDVGNYNKLKKIKDKKRNEQLSEHEIESLMSHSSYKRHKGAIKQVK